MRAGDIENFVKTFNNFGGIYKIEQLKYVKICSLPVSLVILVKRHWIGIHISEDKIEVIDSSGYINKTDMHKSLRTFLRVHILNKEFFCTPRLQPKQTRICGLFVIAFLTFKNLYKKSLCEFCQLLSSNLSLNYDILIKFLNDVKKLRR